MSRDHDAPVEYLRKLASLKLRFGLAALGTAHEALPVAFPMVALDTQLPNGFVGRQDSQLTLRAIACGFLQDGHYGVPTVCRVGAII